MCASLIGVTTAFLFDSHCVVPPPCTCNTNYIRCDSKQLSQVLVISESKEQHSTVYLYFQNNQLTLIPAYAFQNLSSINASSAFVYLTNNHIAGIEPHAFSGIDKAVRLLDLNNNNLTHVPQALSELSALQTLYLHLNPLVLLDASILTSISSNLNTFTLSVKKFSRFPTELNALTKLSSLTINNIQFPLLHSTVFQTFEHSLTSLAMPYSNFESVPAPVCRLKSLTTFTLNYSPNLSKYNASIFDECTHRMTTVTSITLQNNKLTVFPNLVSLFPNLQTLDVSNNLLEFIDSTSIKGLSSLTNLYMNSNKFITIPSAVNRATNLKNLYINNNQIKTVEDFDFQRLQGLRYLQLYGNPLIYVSSYAFIHTPALSTIDFDNTMLGHIPKAMTGLKSIQTFYLSGKRIECSCHAMSYLKPWNVSAINIYARCGNFESVKTFLTTELPKCP